MKVIRHGKKYDTQTATIMGEWSNGDNCRDLYYVYEALYRKKNGEYFLYGCGGPGSCYRESCGSDWWSGGHQISPLSIEEAQKWAEAHLDGDAYEAIFGEVSED